MANKFNTLLSVVEDEKKNLGIIFYLISDKEIKVE
jgi:hypothetical protein